MNLYLDPNLAYYAIKNGMSTDDQIILIRRLLLALDEHDLRAVWSDLADERLMRDLEQTQDEASYRRQ